MFRFGDSDAKFAVKSLKRHEDELTRVLKETVPGLVQGSSEQTAQSTMVQIGKDDRFLEGGHHRVLIKPDAFHVSVLFQPTLAFLDRVAEILPTGVDAARSSSVFLDEFVLNVYLPQLEEKVQSVFHQALAGTCGLYTVQHLASFHLQILMHSNLTRSLLAYQPNLWLK